MARDDRELILRSAIRESNERGSYLFIGAILVIALASLYVAIGTPGLHSQIAKSPLEATSGR